MSKKLKLLQLNVLNFVYFDRIIDLLKDEDPDIVTFQEVSENNLMRSKNFADTSNYDGKDYIKELKEKTDLKFGEFFRSWGVRFEDNQICNWGIGIYSKFSVVDYTYFYDNQAGEYEIIEKHLDPFFISEEKKVRDIYSMQKPSVFAGMLVNINGTLIKVFTGHFVISDLCTETLQRVKQVKQLKRFIDSQKIYPTIIAADFNMTEEGMCVKILNEDYKYMTSNIDNSLDKTIHPIFDPQKAIRGITVDNLKVDHIFGKDIKYINSYSIEDAGVSDHLPIILEFEL